MKNLVILLALLLSTNVMAIKEKPDVTLKTHREDKAKELIIANGCTACHAVNRAVYGPSYYAVARAYENRPDAKFLLARKVRFGGSGKWGSFAMPGFSNQKLSDKDLNLMIDWILSLEPMEVWW